ncbi:MAG TPA: hypothetical protein DF712_04480, partial [Balneola sp.]|nr:hypothetical protein [Balneola sp.]
CLELYNPFTGETMPRKGAALAISPEVQTQITNLSRQRSLINSDLQTIEREQANNLDFRSFLASTVTGSGEDYLYLTGSLLIDDTEIKTYLFDQTQVESFIELFAFFGSEMDDDF